MFFDHFIQEIAEELPHLLDVVTNMVVLIILDSGDTGSAGQGMTAIGQTALEDMMFKILGNLFIDDNPA
jgi:hypothetical protein